jgi:hypothetical protein
VVLKVEGNEDLVRLSAADRLMAESEALLPRLGSLLFHEEEGLTLLGRELGELCLESLSSLSFLFELLLNF